MASAELNGTLSSIVCFYLRTFPELRTMFEDQVVLTFEAMEQQEFHTLHHSLANENCLRARPSLQVESASLLET